MLPNNHTKAAPFRSPAFIVGVGRSGTTLLASILNRHSKVAVTSETHFFRLLEQNGGWEQVKTNWPEKAISFLSGLHHFYLLGIDPHQVTNNVKQPSIGSLFQALGDTFAKQSQKELWIEKTPLHLRYLDEIRTHFPESPILHILRDGRDVALSLCKVNWANKAYIQNLYRWRNELDQAASFLTHDKNLLTIRYENLLTTPTDTIKDVCNFLGISFEPNMLTPDGSESHLLERDSNIKQNVSRPLIPHNSGKWKTELHAALTMGAQWLFKNDLLKWGYAVSTDTPQKLVRIPKHWLVHDNPDHTPPLLLGDKFVSYTAEHNLTICLEDAILLSTPIITNEAIRIAVWEFPEEGIKRYTILSAPRLALQVLAYIARLRLHRVRYAIFIPARRERHKWPYRQLIERFVTRMANAVIHPFNAQENPCADESLNTCNKLIYTSQRDFEQQLTRKMVQHS